MRRRSGRWSRNSPVSRYSNRFTHSRAPFSRTRKRSPCWSKRPYLEPPVPRSRVFSATAAAAAHVGTRDFLRRRALLHVQEGALFAAVLGVDVDRRGVLGDVGVVGAEAGDALAAVPVLQLAQVALDAVGDHLRAFGQFAR